MFRFALISAPSPAMFVRTQWWFWMFLIPIMMWVMRKHVGKSTVMKYTLVSMTRKPFDWPNIILFFKTIGYYFCIYLFPTHLGIHHTYMERYGLTKEETKFALRLDGFLFLGIGLFLLEIYLFFWHWGNPITYGLSWAFLFILPWCNVCTIIQAIAERYCVLSLIGAIYAFVNLIALLPLNYAIGVYCLFLGYYLCRTQIYLKRYADVLRCAEHNCENFEDSAAAWRWRGGLERNLGLVNEAFISWMKAWRLRPYDFVLCNNLATILCQRGQWDEAQKFMDMAKKCPLPTPELAEKWKARQEEFQRVYDEHKRQRDTVFKHARNAICPECHVKYKHCKHGGN
jgi:tetratricopeptide (TPR) repeat protein